MMAMDNKKKNVTVILDRMKGMKEAPMTDGAEDDMSPGYDAAADEVMQAIESKDKKALVSAMKSLVRMCMDEAEPEQE